MSTAIAWMAPVCAIIGILVAAYLGRWVISQDPGSSKMNDLSIKIQQGAKAFLMSEYKLLVIFMLIVAVIMAIALSWITALAFITGGLLSAAAGYVGIGRGHAELDGRTLGVRERGCHADEQRGGDHWFHGDALRSDGLMRQERLRGHRTHRAKFNARQPLSRCGIRMDAARKVLPHGRRIAISP